MLVMRLSYENSLDWFYLTCIGFLMSTASSFIPRRKRLFAVEAIGITQVWSITQLCIVFAYSWEKKLICHYVGAFQKPVVQKRNKSKRKCIKDHTCRGRSGRSARCPVPERRFRYGLAPSLSQILVPLELAPVTLGFVQAESVLFAVASGLRKKGKLTNYFFSVFFLYSNLVKIN